MNNPIDGFARILPALVMACALAAICASPAAAQTAKDLKCRSCLTSKQIKNGKVKGKDLKDSTVTGVKIAPNAVDGGKIADGSVGTADLAGGAVTSDKVADGTIGNADLAANSVTSDKIADGAVGKADLAANAVDSSKVAADSLTAGDLAPDSVGASEIAANAVGTSEIAANAVGTSEVADDSLTANDLAADSVAASEVVDDSIAADDLQNEPGVEFDFDNQTVISTDTSAIENLPITAPSGGFVVVTASGSFHSNVADTVTCSLGTGTTVSNTDKMTAALDGSGGVPFSRTQTFPVAAGSITYRLVCSRAGAGGSLTARDIHIVAMFFPTQY